MESKILKVQIKLRNYTINQNQNLQKVLKLGDFFVF